MKIYTYTSDIWGSEGKSYASLEQFQNSIEDLFQVNDWGECPELHEKNDKVYYDMHGDWQSFVFVGEVEENGKTFEDTFQIPDEEKSTLEFLEKNNILDLDELFNAIKEDRAPLNTSLPIYGGEEPKEKSGVWSWDDCRLMVGTCRDDMKLQYR